QKTGHDDRCFVKIPAPQLDKVGCGVASDRPIDGGIAVCSEGEKAEPDRVQPVIGTEAIDNAAVRQIGLFEHQQADRAIAIRVCSRTFVPFTTSSQREYSAGLWLIPPIDGIKNRPVGVKLLIVWALWLA